jgi:ABC-type uncharacterized transport system substrate-binding protein
MGFVEGRNVKIDYLFGEDQPDRLPAPAAELVRRGAAVIFVTGSLSSILAVKAAIMTIPIVFGVGGDPVQDGLVASLNRPGGNVTGINFMLLELTAKRIGLLHELLPAAARFALLVDPRDKLNVAPVIADAQAAASIIGRQIEIFTASTDDEIDSAFTTMVRWGAEALLIGTGPLFFVRRAQVAALATRHALPAIYFSREFVEAGGLMSYGTSIADANREAGIYVGRILKGENPADLPVQQSTKFELVINLKAAKTISLTIPPGVLAIADEVIE